MCMEAPSQQCSIVSPMYVYVDTRDGPLIGLCCLFVFVTDVFFDWWAQDATTRQQEPFHDNILESIQSALEAIYHVYYGPTFCRGPCDIREMIRSVKLSV